ncbi:MAG: hypothetical protein IPL52_03260 [Flavobacteriales bacterium]|nr:hypothetical protein [Flavobacteriales bacterium]
MKKIRRIAQQNEFRADHGVRAWRRSTHGELEGHQRRGRIMVNQYQDERAQQVFAAPSTPAA